ncbi:hypothetical protein [Rhodoferax bucti]|uniref:hypothetical protein n=1 Tax=Rhodoferax bucti TaxID=2576305 RepID=UPI0014774D67|nr:hypothetical protein [Rhodoferax bucti]
MITREDLYELIWTTPMTKVAAQFEVSGSFLARICSILRVPRPERGYWAKLAVGKAPGRPPLPEAQPGDQVSWSKDGDFHFAKKPRRTALPESKANKPRLPVTGMHSLVRGANAHFQASRKVEEGQHLKPYKNLLLDVTTSMAGLDKALAFANDFFNALESAGHRVVLSPQDEPVDFAHNGVQHWGNLARSYERCKLLVHIHSSRTLFRRKPRFHDAL